MGIYKQLTGQDEYNQKKERVLALIEEIDPTLVEGLKEMLKGESFETHGVPNTHIATYGITNGLNDNTNELIKELNSTLIDIYVDSAKI